MLIKGTKLTLKKNRYVVVISERVTNINRSIFTNFRVYTKHNKEKE